MSVSWRRVLFPLAVGLAALMPLTAMASTFGVSFGSPKLTARTLVTLPVTVTCTIDPSVATYIFDESITAFIQQPVGKSFATASGGASGYSGGTLAFPCDGSTTTVMLSLLANPSGPPFHGGPAIVTASLSVTAGFESFPGCGCGPITFFQNASAGPSAVTLH